MSETDTGVGISLRFTVFSCLHPVIRTESTASVNTLILDFIFFIVLLFLLGVLVICYGSHRLILFKIIQGKYLQVKKLNLIVDDSLSV